MPDIASFKNPNIPRAPFWLGSAGIVPLAAATLIYLFARTPEQRQFGLQAFCAYSAVILSFLGGIRWGAALVLPSFKLLFRAIMPSLIAAGCLLLPPNYAVPLLGASFLMLGLSDSTQTVHALWPLWFKRLRLMLSVAVICLHLVVLLAIRGVFA